MKTRLLLFVLPLALLPACQTVAQPKGSSHGYRSARLVRPHAAPAVANPDDRVNHAIQSALASTFRANGFDIQSPDAELTVAYLVLVQDNVTTTLINDYFGFGRNAMDIANLAHERGVIRNNTADSYESGTVVIDILDNKTGKLVYRDHATRDVTGGLSDAQLKARADSAVQQALAKFFRK
jgi:hypothetical protein